MIILDGLDDVLGDLVHIEKTRANAPTCHAANLSHCSGQARRSKMLEQIVNEGVIKLLIFSRDIETFP